MSDQIEMKSYTTFFVTDREGNEVELAVVDEFRVEGAPYIAAARIEGDEVNENQVFLYKVKVGEEDFEVEQISDMEEYEKVADAYMSL
ncbi:MAG: DUF1292 domain-containing protein [Lachnospiraceae bacterium]|nr:DUF1292 domain-containing protein [Candidatus Equihabitans merdae]